MPREPVRTIATSIPARRAAPRMARGDVVGAAGDGGGVAGDEDADHASSPSMTASSRVGVEAADDLAVDHRRGAGGAEAEAVDGLEGHALGAGAAAAGAEARLGAGDEGLAAHRLAGLGAAELDDVPAGGGVAEVVVEGHDAVDLGARQVERLGDHRHGLAGHVAEGRLDVVEDRQERALAAGMPPDDGQRLGLAPLGRAPHSLASPAPPRQASPTMAHAHAGPGGSATSSPHSNPGPGVVHSSLRRERGREAATAENARVLDAHADVEASLDTG